jgi:hypothetical protein
MRIALLNSSDNGTNPSKSLNEAHKEPQWQMTLQVEVPRLALGYCRTTS